MKKPQDIKASDSMPLLAKKLSYIYWLGHYEHQITDDKKVHKLAMAGTRRDKKKWLNVATKIWDEIHG